MEVSRALLRLILGLLNLMTPTGTISRRAACLFLFFSACIVHVQFYFSIFPSSTDLLHLLVGEGDVCLASRQRSMDYVVLSSKLRRTVIYTLRSCQRNIAVRCPCAVCCTVDGGASYAHNLLPITWNTILLGRRLLKIKAGIVLFKLDWATHDLTSIDKRGK